MQIVFYEYSKKTKQNKAKNHRDFLWGGNVCFAER